jgi:hypothetical protein
LIQELFTTWRCCIDWSYCLVAKLHFLNWKIYCEKKTMCRIFKRVVYGFPSLSQVINGQKAQNGTKRPQNTHVTEVVKDMCDNWMLSFYNVFGQRWVFIL